MDYVITFEDDSQALMHYGVQGMKWGKWNAETQRRYAGAGNGTYFRKSTHGDEISRSVTDRRRAYNANQSKGKQIAKNVLLNPAGAHAYNTARSRGLSRADALQVAPLGPIYAQGVKNKQHNLGTKDPMISRAAKERADYTKGESLKKSAAKAFLLGNAGSISYNSVKARTKSRGKAAVAAAVANVGVVLGAAGGQILGGATGLGMGQIADTFARAAGSKVSEYAVSNVMGTAGEGLATQLSNAAVGRAMRSSKKGYGKNVRGDEFRRENAEQAKARKQREKLNRGYKD